ncbi:MAG: hypothetical protein IPM12_00205 [Flavobacteriales bacterium]|nr:hypothetical protein [Flavobacteriales bacterium]
MRTLLLFSALSVSGCAVDAQWCMPTTAIPYGPNMPGITQFSCNSISRVSADIENYPSNSYVNTGLTTTLVRGMSYPITMGFTIDALISPHMNLRIWIDFNHDGQLDDAGETLLSVDHVAGPTHAGQITIPANAMTGPTRMRVTAKMCSHGGHTVPTPCDYPVDPLGYHGEIEDYTVNIADAVGIEEQALLSRLALVPEADEVSFLFTLLVPGEVRLELLDAAGRVLHAGSTVSMHQGDHRARLPFKAAQGAYFGRIWLNGEPYTIRMAR